MKYYKLVKDKQIIGAINSHNFISYSPVAEGFLHSDETLGEYISYHGQIYRSTWMQPIIKQKNYVPISAIEITEEEYNIYNNAIEKNEEIYDQRKEETIEEFKYDNVTEVNSLNFIRISKLNEMSYACHKTIEAGIDIELRGETHHFSLDTQDQLNLMTLSTLAQTQELIPYHADGEECIFYTADEIETIVDKTTSFKIYHTTYYNALKTYINALETIEEISAITYGTTIPEEYKSDVLKTLENQMK